jgi:hypothetical protein
MKQPRPPLPDCPTGSNPFFWIIRTAPMVRQARREIAERERQERQHETQQDARPAQIGRR